jgi:hypothetical protein
MYVVWGMHFFKTIWDAAEATRYWAEAFALVCAGLFFLYRAFAGYFRVNLSLSLNCKRQHLDGDRDYLVVILHLKKGDNGSLALHEAAATIMYNGSKEVSHFPSVTRLDTNRPETNAPCKIDWEQIDSQSPLLNIIPGEEADFSLWREVPCNAVCQIEAVVIGQKLSGHPVGQWRVSCVSLPIVKDTAVASEASQKS